MVLAPYIAGGHQRCNAGKDLGAILGKGGVDYMIIPVGDKRYENAARTTVTTKGQGAGAGLICTYSLAITAFDSPVRHGHNQLSLPDVSFNGTDEYGSIPDTDFLSFGDGVTDEAFSGGIWVNVETGSDRSLLGKYGGNPDREYWFNMDNPRPQLNLADASGPFVITRRADNPAPTGALMYLGFTYNGVGGANAADGITLYVNGGETPSTATNNASYVAMENGPKTFGLGSWQGSAGNLFRDRMGGGDFGPYLTHRGLSTIDHSQIYRIGRAAHQ